MGLGEALLGEVAPQVPNLLGDVDSWSWKSRVMM